jgi:hypothetical protein
VLWSMTLINPLCRGWCDVSDTTLKDDRQSLGGTTCMAQREWALPNTLQSLFFIIIKRLEHI